MSPKMFSQDKGFEEGENCIREHTTELRNQVGMAREKLGGARSGPTLLAKLCGVILGMEIFRR